MRAIPLALLLATGLAGPATSVAQTISLVPVEGASHAHRLPDRYIVLYRESKLTQKGAILEDSTFRKQNPAGFARADQDARTEHALLANKMISGTNAQVEWVLGPATPGFIVTANAAALAKLQADPSVQAIIADQEIPNVLTTLQGPTPNWGIDRIDQRNLPLNNTYSYPLSGTGVHVYVMDSGIRTTHEDFGFRATNDANFVTDGQGNTDCNGHGTRVASIIGGIKHGVAKNVRIHSVRNVGCQGGSNRAWVLSSLDWLGSYAYWGSIVNISQSWFDNCAAEGTFCSSVERSLARLTGVTTVVVAAGNHGSSTVQNWPSFAGNYSSTTDVIVVGATTRTDRLWSDSNRQGWINVFAPGADILTATRNSDTSTGTDSGTSLAAPHVAGALALWRQLNPEHLTSYADFELETVHSTQNVIVGSTGNAPNRLLYTGNLQAPGGDNPDDPGGSPPPNPAMNTMPAIMYLLSEVLDLNGPPVAASVSSPQAESSAVAQ